MSDPVQAIDDAGNAYARALARLAQLDGLTARGDLAAALAEARLARSVLTGRDADRLDAAMARTLAGAGRLQESLALAEDTLRRLRRSGDVATRIDLLVSLGRAQAERGSTGCAVTALTEAVGLAERARLGRRAASAGADLARAVALTGNLPRALALFASVQPRLHGAASVRCRLAHAETLLTAGLPGEARALLDVSVLAAREAGHGALAADSLLLLGHAALAEGDADAATAIAGRALTAFAEQHRHGYVPVAEHLLVRARWAAGERSALLLGTATAVAARLDGAGWVSAAAEARVVAARVALCLGRPDPGGHRARGPVAVRIASLHATALDRFARSDRDGALNAVRTGLRLLEEHADALGAHELRAHATGLGADLAEFGAKLARTPRELLDAEERRRSIVRRLVAVRPPPDRARAETLATLRSLSAAQTTATARGAFCPVLAERLTRLEAGLRATALHRDAPPTQGPPPRLNVERLAAALGERVLVELVRIGDALHAVTVRDGHVRRHTLGGYGAARQAALLLRSALDRAAEGEFERLPELPVLEPLRDVLGDRAVVLAPTAALHGVPWAAAAPLAGRPFTVVPSAAAWLHAFERPAAPGPVVLAAGPGLGHTDRELRSLARVHPASVTLTGEAATVPAVTAALDGAALAHLAAHGTFRSGNPLFSHLRLHDGPLCVHDLEDVPVLPRVLVLAACDAGLSAAGDAVLGLPGALLALGAATVVASVTRVSDEAAPAFMESLHRALGSGVAPAEALARTPPHPGTAGFMCFGAG
ncbi:CHAT domain-containing protein [Actinomadura flavalba]|uniref:CHAT domain-containing protein n=1 Tax=Actinomadura flavalba TaxID=1120938 RepID=UPI00039A6BF5|nr:CHAT domain-containing protein [Actinomadura flavalba]